MSVLPRVSPLGQKPVKMRCQSLLIVLGVALVGVLGGCGGGATLNPAFPVTPESARVQIAQIKRDRESTRLERPVVVIGGLLDPLDRGVNELGDRLAELLPAEQRPLVIPLSGTQTTEDARRRVLIAVQGAFPGIDAGETAEVDVVGFSLGGVVARDAAIARSGEARLRIVRLFTLAAPHRGTTSAEPPTFDDRIAAIRPGSAYITRLNAELPRLDYEIIPYSRLGDLIVETERAAPPGASPWWVPNLPLQRAHGEINADPRVLADIARRLRGEPALTVPPAIPEPVN